MPQRLAATGGRIDMTQTLLSDGDLPGHFFSGVCVHGPRVTSVQTKARYSSTEADRAARSEPGGGCAGLSGRFWQRLRGSRLAGSGLGVGTVIRRPFLGRKPQVRSNEFRYYFPVRIGSTIRRGAQGMTGTDRARFTEQHLSDVPSPIKEVVQPQGVAFEKSHSR
jgi:hypothetical protein